MTMAQFSRDDILIYQGREENREEMIQEMLKDRLSVNKIAQYANIDIEYILKIQSDMIERGQL